MTDISLAVVLSFCAWLLNLSPSVYWRLSLSSVSSQPFLWNWLYVYHRFTLGFVFSSVNRCINYLYKYHASAILDFIWGSIYCYMIFSLVLQQILLVLKSIDYIDFLGLYEHFNNIDISKLWICRFFVIFILYPQSLFLNFLPILF